MLHMKFGFAMIGQAVSDENIFEIVDERTTDGRTTEHGHPIR